MKMFALHSGPNRTAVQLIYGMVLLFTMKTDTKMKNKEKTKFHSDPRDSLSDWLPERHEIINLR